MPIVGYSVASIVRGVLPQTRSNCFIKAKAMPWKFLGQVRQKPQKHADSLSRQRPCHENYSRNWARTRKNTQLGRSVLVQKGRSVTKFNRRRLWHQSTCQPESACRGGM